MLREEDIRDFIASSGEELAALILPKFISKITDELSTVVGRMQRAMGEAESAMTAANQRLTDIERSIVEKKAVLAELIKEIREKTSTVDALTAQFNSLDPLVKTLKSESLRHAEQNLKILAGE